MLYKRCLIPGTDRALISRPAVRNTGNVSVNVAPRTVAGSRTPVGIVVPVSLTTSSTPVAQSSTTHGAVSRIGTAIVYVTAIGSVTGTFPWTPATHVASATSAESYTALTTSLR